MNLVTDSLPALALGLDENNDNVMNESPRNANAGFFSGKRGINILYQGVLQGMLTLLSFFIGIYFFDLNTAETMAFTISWALSDTGKTRFPRSVFSGTPNSSKNAMVSAGSNALSAA